MVNIVIPHYNNEDGLFDALRSLENQTKKMFFVTIVDDHSKNEDKLNTIIDKFKKTLKIIFIRNEENRGPGNSRNKGIEVSIKNGFSETMFLDSDDILQPRAVEILSRELKGSLEADFISSPILAETKYGKSHTIMPSDALTWLHGKIYRTDFLEKYNIKFPENILFNEDSYFNLVCRYLSTKEFYTLDENFYIWRDNKNSVTRTNKYDFVEMHGADYIIGQCEAILKICSIQSDATRLTNLITTITNIYNSYMLELFFEHDVTALNKKIEQVLACEAYLNIFTPQNLKQKVFPKISSVLTYKKDYFFPIMNFLEWTKQFNNKSLYRKVLEATKCHKL